MSTFLDTSGVYAVLDAGDANHVAAAVAWRGLVDSGYGFGDQSEQG